MEYEMIIGLEVHVRVKSKTKMLCSCKNAVALAPEPNINICPICSGFPGMLPQLNEEVVKLGLLGGMMMNCKINKVSRFDRKSYYYPDSPNAFQTTQLFDPIVGAGSVKTLVNGEEKNFGIHHMHLENDAGKLTHGGGKTLIDFNRAGSPLMEIVTDPVFTNAEDSVEFLREIQKLMRASKVSDADMDKGQMRCDVNLSIKPVGQEEFGIRTEHKNVNSFGAVSRVIASEYKRQLKIIKAGGVIDQETRGWDDDSGKSSSLRSKENAMDYRYFPEPDLLPIILSDDFIEETKKGIVEFPIERRIRYLKTHKLQPDDARLLTADYELSSYFEELFKLTNDAKKSCSYITTILLALIKDSEDEINISNLNFKVSQLAKVINLVNKDELSSTNSKLVIEELFNNGGNADEIIDSKKLRQKNDLSSLETIVDEVIKNNSKQVEDYRGGNENIFGFFVGQCMKASRGQGNPKIFNEILKKKL
ncbi:MAG: Asp-tRNA(Asn)/Glu-tRNA(Gln) amidotransferase subunit GatB [Candidatus Gracilibacteria bacterium]|nr:Asp-tRNA(Asn)/Glu-tRNA(Gln) amidotransferase subunit GatB [Candidatus Gracilibacteria bacterium]MDQ7022279.1 Asp-tRNA(Asn)/Glu-tRNA(Gln) amidotransferase subunit GatB [Candidatus Gracilibacteria bacterium]